MPELSDNIVTLRKQNKMSQSDLAGELYVTPQAISRWERGETQPDVETIKKLAEVFNCTVEEVINGPTSKLSKRITKILHICYFIGSIGIILFSITFMILALAGINVLTLFIVFVITSLTYLLFLMVCEIIQLRLKYTSNKTNNEKNAKK